MLATIWPRPSLRLLDHHYEPDCAPTDHAQIPWTWTHHSAIVSRSTTAKKDSFGFCGFNVDPGLAAQKRMMGFWGAGLTHDANYIKAFFWEEVWFEPMAFLWHWSTHLDWCRGHHPFGTFTNACMHKQTPCWQMKWVLGLNLTWGDPWCPPAARPRLEKPFSV